MTTRQRMLVGYLGVAGCILMAAGALWLLYDAITTGEFERRGASYTWVENRLTFEFHLFKLALGAFACVVIGAFLAWVVPDTPKADREIDRLARAKMERDEVPETSTLLDEHSRQLEGHRLTGRSKLLDSKIKVSRKRVDDALD